MTGTWHHAYKEPPGAIFLSVKKRSGGFKKVNSAQVFRDGFCRLVLVTKNNSRKWALQ